MRHKTTNSSCVSLVRILCPIAAVFLATDPVLAQDREPAPGTPAILEAIAKLEGQNDPKCHATASRLEDLIYGTPLSTEARFAKNELLKSLVLATWTAAAKQSNPTPDTPEISAQPMRTAIANWLTAEKKEDGAWSVRLRDRPPLLVSDRDLRHYGSIAYSLRAILAVQHDRLFGLANPGPPLSSDALSILKERLDLALLAILQQADRDARAANEPEISKQRLETTWNDLFGPASEPSPAKPAPATPASPLLQKIIKQKAASYSAYNQVSSKIFVRNMQVYFARLSWPRDPQVAKQFRQQYIESVVAFAADLLALSAREATARGETIVRERDVAAAARKFLPHRVNEYEDVLFFPNLPPEERIAIEFYDLDAFRDSGGHWHYLGFALDDLKKKGKAPEADPFAAELLAENVAQFGVLFLRVAGREGIALDRERLSPDLLALAAKRIQALLARHALAAPAPAPEATLPSAPESGPRPAGLAFTEITPASKIAFEHRSSSWLNRLLRTYLKTSEKDGTLTIPPAFGGAGVAADDLDGDGRSDLLLLGGLGNKLYHNLGDGTFRDVTTTSGLSWLRPDDGRPGEARQPLVADFDNDGVQDVLITYAGDAHRLYRGLGEMRFADVTTQAGLGGAGLVGGPATTFDFDNDGLLDIYLSYFGDYPRGVLPTLKRHNNNGTPNKLFRNLGGLRFQDVTAKAGVGDAGWGQSAIHTDFDGDGWQDLISGNDFGVNYYYRNNHDGTFTEVSNKLGTDKPSFTMSLAAADLNGDLHPDLYVSNIVTMNKDEKYVLPNENTRMKFSLEKLANLRTVEANDLFLSRKEPAGASPAIRYDLNRIVLTRDHSATGWAWDADFFDADHDGDDDLYVLNGMNEFNLYSSRNPYFMDAKQLKEDRRFLPVAAREANVFFRNRDGKLRNDSTQSGLDFLGNSRSAACFDLENDGDLDIVTNDYHGPARLFRNNLSGPNRNWIKLKLIGDPANGINRDAIGATVVITLRNGATIWRQVSSTTGYMSVHPKTIHAGLGDAKEVDVEVKWPNGGTKLLKNLPANGIHTVLSN